MVEKVFTPSPDPRRGGRQAILAQRLQALCELQQDMLQLLAGMCPEHPLLPSLTARLQAAHAGAQSEMETLAEDLEALERRCATLIAARDGAEQENRGKAQLLAAASHDLLQPLGATRLFLSTLKSTQLRPQNRKVVERADKALSSAELLLGSLLEISEIDARGAQPQITHFPISSLLATLENEFEPAAARKGISLSVVMSNTRVVSDLTMLRRILQNLVSNAITYTESGKVLLGCRRRRDGLRIEVWDTGQGIPPGETERIFEEFYRIRPAKRGEGGRAGLGLSIIRRLARTLEHPISITSQPGRGSCFAVTVPYGRVMMALRPDDIAPRPRPRSLSNILAVVVENDQDMLQAISAQLAHWSCQVVAARSPEVALTKMAHANRRPDIMIVDQHLDRSQTGLEFIDRVRMQQKASLPAILITADRSADLKERALRQRCEFLTKPFQPAELRARIGAMLR